MGKFSVLAEFPAHLVTMLVLLAAAGFFSGAETALFNLTREQLRRFRASRSPLHRLAARLMDDPRGLLVAVLFGNTVVSTAFFVTGAVLIHGVAEAHPEHGGYWRVIIAAATPLALIIFGEVTPKSIGAIVPEFLAPLVSGPLALLEYAVWPIRVALVGALVMPLERLITGPRSEDRSFVTTEELQAVIETAAREGAVSAEEGDMLTDILDLGDLKVRDVMTPRVEVAGCDIVTPMPIVLAVFRRTRRTKMVVYEDEMDRTAGVVYAKTAFLNPDRPLAELVRPVYYVPETKTVEGLLKEFRARKVQFAVVVDEYGGVSGLVTLEDCLEEIVGEIEDETDRPAGEPVRRISESEYLLAGNLSVRSWADLFDAAIPEGGARYSTVAGFVTTLLGRVPRPGDGARWRNLEFTVEDVRHRRVTRVRLRLLGPAGREAGGPAAPGGQREDT